MWAIVTEALVGLLSLVTLGVVLVERREAAATLAWALAVVLLPVVGPLLFFILAWHRPQRELRREQARVPQLCPQTASGSASVMDGEILEREDLRAVARAIERMEGYRARAGNAVEFAADGESFARMLLSSIRSAERSVHLEFYIYRNDEAGQEVTAALVEKARQGVECRLLLDAVGALWFQTGCLARLREAGVKVDFFHPMNPLRRRFAVHYRLHRKIAVFDGQSALTGGRNVGNEYLDRRRGDRSWQDLSFLVRGPAAADLQRIFLGDWYYTTHELLDPGEYCPMTEPVGGKVVQVVPSYPHALGGAVEFAYLMAMRTARRSLRLATPYFVPPPSVLSAIMSAALAGVQVEIIVPSVSDTPLTLWAGRSAYRELIEAGVRIYEYHEGMLHGKLAIVDEQWCTAGSANLDCRSFRLSFEVNCFIYDPEASGTLTTLFDAYRAKSSLIENPAQYDQGLRDRLRCGVTRLAGPLL